MASERRWNMMKITWNDRRWDTTRRVWCEMKRYDLKFWHFMLSLVPTTFSFAEVTTNHPRRAATREGSDRGRWRHGGVVKTHEKNRWKACEGCFKINIHIYICIQYTGIFIHVVRYGSGGYLHPHKGHEANVGVCKTCKSQCSLPLENVPAPSLKKQRSVHAWDSKTGTKYVVGDLRAWYTFQFPRKKRYNSKSGGQQHPKQHRS